MLGACDARRSGPPAAPPLPPERLSAASETSREQPPRNPYLADGPYPVAHADSAQSDAGPIAGPIDQSRALRPEEIRYLFIGPAPLGALTSGRYPDGRRVLWLNAVNGVFKLDEANYQILADTPTRFARIYTSAWAEEITARLDADNGESALQTVGDALRPLGDLSGAYTLVGANNWFYVASKDGSVTAYGDAVENDPASPIVVKARIRLPAEAAGNTIGMNITYDGWVIIATESGYVVAVSGALDRSQAVRLRYADTEDTRSRGPGDGWVRNSFAIDEAGGIYVASRNHMHKVVWTGERLSIASSDGAWAEPYRNGGGAGTGATPTLMGFGDEDRLVVITDGDERMNLTLFWRDAIPDNWVQLPGAPSLRIAGLAPATVGDPSLRHVQSEQSVAVSGYGAFVVNNTPRNAPIYLPADRAFGALCGGLGSNPRFQPFGVQKFEWDAGSRTLFSAWERADVSSPNAVPWISRGSSQVYFIGARENQWTLEALNWITGEPTFHYVIGGQKFNSTFSGVSIDDAGRIVYASMWGRVRLEPAPQTPA